MHAQSFQSRLTLSDPMHYNLSGSSVHGILQVRILEWVTMPSFRGLPKPGIEPASLMFPALAGGFFNTSATWEVKYMIYIVIIYSFILAGRRKLSVSQLSVQDISEQRLKSTRVTNKHYTFISLRISQHFLTCNYNLLV